MPEDDNSIPVHSSEESKRQPLCRLPTKAEVKEAKAKDTRKSNRIASYLIPPLLVLLMIFSTYVWFDMCIQWYLRNNYTGTGVCLLVFQIILLVLTSLAFFRITFTKAGYIPNQADRLRYARNDSENTLGTNASIINARYEDRPKTYDRRPTLHEIDKFQKTQTLSDAEFYIARPDSLTSPRYCHICDVVKHDRVHHCSEVNRCVKKFDHFCPWVGGPLGHTRYKFFFQFISYVAIYCVYTTITLGVAVSQRRRAQHRMDNTQHIPANPGLWYTSIALAGFFALMMVPFSIFHGRQIVSNKSTLESIEARAIQVIVQTRVLDTQGNATVSQQRVTLAPGDNPFDLGWFKNWQQVMGTFVMDKWVLLRVMNWLIPLRGR